jgi:prephenate dehydrogenase
VWSELFFLNKEALLKRMNDFMDEMSALKCMIEEEDEAGIKEKMRLSTKRRARFNKE